MRSEVLKRAVLWIVLSTVYIGSLSYFLLPYFPFPSDDVPFKWGAEGEIIERYRSIRLTIYIYRFFADLLPLPTFDAMVITVLVVNLLTAFFLFEIVRKIKGGIWATVGAVLYLLSEWTLLYPQFLGHAPFLSLFFAINVYLAIRIHENTGRTFKTSILWLAYTTSLYCLVFSSSAGIFWLGIGLAFLSFIFAPEVFASLRHGLCISIKRGARFTTSRAVPLFVAGLPFYVVLVNYLRNKYKFIADQYQANVQSLHFEKASDLFNETLTTQPWAVLKTVFYHTPVLSLLTICLVVLLILKRSHDRILMSLVAVMILAFTLGELLPFTKLGRSFFAFNFLICLIFILSLPNKKAWVLPVFTVIAFDLHRFSDQVEVRFGLSRFLSQYYGKVDFYAFKNDEHYKPIMRTLTEDYKITFIDDVKEAKRPAIVIVGPRGEKSGQSVMKSCLLEDFTKEITKPVNGTEYSFRYSGYLESIYLEEEVCQTLHFKNRSVDINEPDKQVLVWVMN